LKVASLEKLNLQAEDLRRIDPNQCLVIAQEALQLAMQEKNLIQQGKALHNIGEAYIWKSEFDKAFEFSFGALKIFNGAKNTADLGAVYYSIGTIFFYLSDYDNALEEYMKSYKNYDLAKNEHGVAESLNGIGSVYYAINDNNKAIHYLNTCLESCNILKNNKLKQKVLDGLGRAYKNLQDYSKALYYLEECVNLIDEINGNPHVKAHAFNNMGDVYFFQDNFEQALTYFEAIQGIQTQTTQEEVFKASIWLNIGRCYINMGEREKGKEKIFQALDHLRNFLRPPSQDFVQEYVAAGDYEMLEENLEKALIMYDSALRNGIAEYKEDMFIFPESMDVEISISDLQALQKKSLALEKLSQIQGTPDRFAKAGLEYVNRTHRELVKNRSNLIATEGKLFLSEQFKRLYESGISICYQLFDKTKDPKYAQQGLRSLRSKTAIL